MRSLARAGRVQAAVAPDQLTSVTDFNGTTSQITNTADGLPATLALGATGDSVTTSYDQAENPSAIKLTDGSSTLAAFAYQYTPAGTISSEADTPASSFATAGYGYDAQGRVTQQTLGASSPSNYGYDASGNLTTLPTRAAATYNAASELTSSTLAATTTSYTYNQDGERTPSEHPRRDDRQRHLQRRATAHQLHQHGREHDRGNL